MVSEQLDLTVYTMNSVGWFAVLSHGPFPNPNSRPFSQVWYSQYHMDRDKCMDEVARVLTNPNALRLSNPKGISVPPSVGQPVFDELHKLLTPYKSTPDCWAGVRAEADAQGNIEYYAGAASAGKILNLSRVVRLMNSIQPVLSKPADGDDLLDLVTF